jgi:hypothetical protein
VRPQVWQRCAHLLADVVGDLGQVDQQHVKPSQFVCVGGGVAARVGLPQVQRGKRCGGEAAADPGQEVFGRLPVPWLAPLPGLGGIEQVPPGAVRAFRGPRDGIAGADLHKSPVRVVEVELDLLAACGRQVREDVAELVADFQHWGVRRQQAAYPGDGLRP